MLDSKDLTKLEKLREEFYTCEFGLKLLDRMSIKPTDIGAIEECRGIYNLSALLKRLYIEAFDKIQELEKLEEMGSYNRPKSSLPINMAKITKQAIEHTEAIKNVATN